MSAGRLVWISEELLGWAMETVERSERVPGAPRQPFMRSIQRAYDAAPADPVAAVRTILEDIDGVDEPYGWAAEVVLRALGVPGHATQDGEADA